MCLFGKKQKTSFKETPPPEKGAEPLEVGSARTAEDEALFGGQPNLAVNRDNAAPAGVTSGGSGLRMM